MITGLVVIIMQYKTYTGLFNQECEAARKGTSRTELAS